MKWLLIAAVVFLALDFLGFGKGKFKKASGVLAVGAGVLLVLYLLGILLGFVLKIILLLLGVYIVIRLINAIKDII